MRTQSHVALPDAYNLSAVCSKRHSLFLNSSLVRVRHCQLKQLLPWTYAITGLLITGEFRKNDAREPFCQAYSAVGRKLKALLTNNRKPIYEWTPIISVSVSAAALLYFLTSVIFIPHIFRSHLSSGAISDIGNSNTWSDELCLYTSFVFGRSRVEYSSSKAWNAVGESPCEWIRRETWRRKCAAALIGLNSSG